MPLFTVSKTSLQPVAQSKFASEKALQQLVEGNLEVVFNCRLVATEFSTGAQHSGRIDTLALSEDHNPVIIEYKNVESSDLINQSLFYLSWIDDHRGNFEIAAQRALGAKTEVDWTDVRVICIAPNYRKYDLHAVRMMGANIELWTYRLFASGVLYLEEILQKSDSGIGGPTSGKNPVMVAAGSTSGPSSSPPWLRTTSSAWATCISRMPYWLDLEGPSPSRRLWRDGDEIWPRRRPRATGPRWNVAFRVAKTTPQRRSKPAYSSTPSSRSLARAARGSIHLSSSWRRRMASGVCSWNASLRK